MTIEPPPGFVFRAPMPDDAQSIADLIVACDIANSGESDVTVTDLLDSWRATSFNLATDAWVATTPDGLIVGYEELTDLGQDDPAYMDGYVHPEFKGHGLGTALVRTAEARIRETMRGEHTSVRLNVSGNDQAAREMFEREGYELIRHFWRMQLEIDAPPEPPAWPEGITVRTFVPGRDERVTHAVMEETFADHWGHVQVPFEEWVKTRIPSEGFDPTLWFLAMDGDEVAGAALCRPRGEGGWVRGLGVRRAWRRRGLGMALLRHAFGVFYERGIRSVGLGVDAQSLTGATRLYKQVGMHVTEQYDTFSKELTR